MLCVWGFEAKIKEHMFESPMCKFSWASGKINSANSIWCEHTSWKIKKVKIKECQKLLRKYLVTLGHYIVLLQVMKCEVKFVVFQIPM